MNASTETYILKQKLKDDRFNIDHLQYYNLSLQIGTYDFRITVIDSRNHRCLILEDYIFQQPSAITSSLQNVFEDHHFLKAGFWSSIKIAFKNNLFSLVPLSLFDKEHLQDYLHTTGSHGDHSLHYYKHDKLKAINVFGTDKELINFFTAAYPGATLHFLHQASALIEGVHKYGDFSHQRNMTLFVEKGAINILVHQEEKLFFCNRFPYTSPQQMMQYIMVVMHELQLDQYATRVMVWGDIEANSQEFDMLQTYIYNISFGGKLTLFSYNYVFDELEDHNYFDLFSIYLCD